MCFYCGKVIEKEDMTHSDHVISIVQMLVSLKIDKNILWNFERVHKKCNLDASKLPINILWNMIGTIAFPGPTYNRYAIDEVNNTIDHTEQLELNQQWCRGYLLMEILKNLEIVNQSEQKARIINIKNSVNILYNTIEELSYLVGFPKLDSDAANILLNMKYIKY